MQDKPIDQMADMLASRVFLAGLFSWLIAQILKALNGRLRGRFQPPAEMVTTLLWRTGGMPSSHSALVAGLCASIGLIHGVTTSLFALSFFYALVVIRDALGVRRSAGMQARTLNQLGRTVAERLDIEFDPVQEVMGHSSIEVFAGVLLGLAVGVVFSLV